MKKTFYKLQGIVTSINKDIILGIMGIYLFINIITLIHNGEDDFSKYCNNRKAINRIHSILIGLEVPVRKTACWLFLPYKE